MGKESRIIGKSRIVPVSTPDDNEIIVTIKIIPIKYNKEHCFMVLFNKIEFHDRFLDFGAEFRTLKTKLKKIGKKEEFKEDSAESRVLVGEISMLFRKEFEVIGDFIIENQYSPRVLVMCKHFLIGSPIGKLSYLYKELDRRYGGDTIPYLNICCVRIIFPSVSATIDASFLNNLKSSLYEDYTGDTS